MLIGKATVKMQSLDLNDFIEFNDQKVNPVVLANEPDMRLLLLCMRAGQQVPEHSAAGSITVQAIIGRATFYDGDKACEMFAGSLVRLEAGRAHRVEAHTDAALLVTMVKTSRLLCGSAD
jgi:quercetin dioxygenase-like cupin family protein